MNLKIEVADNPQLLTKGLMGRKDLPKDAGMLFKFPSITEAKFWGKNTYLPLDVAFVNQDNKIIDIKHIAPMSTRTVASSGLCSVAIEANAGFFKNNNIDIGQTVSFVLDENGKEKEVSFDA